MLDKTPLNIQRYIQLNSQKKLPRKTIIAWYRSVQRYAPSGVMLVVPTTDDQARPTTVRLVHRTTEHHHSYLVPLSRDLTDDEVEIVVRGFAQRMPDLNFEVETSETKLFAHEYGEIPLDTAKFAVLCRALAKQQHEDWVRERTDAGWRYGTTFNRRAKTHPLLRPWDQLPDQYRKPNVSLPQTLLKLLSNHGYAVLHREDLDQLRPKLD